MISEVFVDWMRRGQRLVEAWRHDRSGSTDADLATLASQQARFTELTAADLSGRFAAIPELADLLPRQLLRVAELGCGGGFYLDAMATAWPTAELIGYDPDPVALALAAERLGSNPRVSLRQVDARRVADDGPFDLILMVDALHDMADTAGVLNAARQALAKAGVIAIAERNWATSLRCLTACTIRSSRAALAPSVPSCERAISKRGVPPPRSQSAPCMTMMPRLRACSSSS